MTDIDTAPTVESLALQGVLVAAALVAVVWALRPMPAGERA